MTDATARYVISADDRTKSAISSIKRGFTDLDSSAKTVGRTLKGLTTGAAFYGLARGVQALFRNAAESSGPFNDALTRVKKSFHDLLTPKSGIPAATKALDDLNKTLADPQVKAGADQLFSFLIKSAATLAELTAKTVSNLTTVGKGLGLIKGGRQDEIDRLIVEIAERRQGKSALSRGFGKVFSGVGGENEAQVLESLESRLYQLQYAQSVTRTRQSRIASGVRGGRDRGDGFDIKPVTETPLGRLDIGLNARAAELASGLKMDDFGDDLLKSTEGIADQMAEIFKEPFDQLSPYADEAARNMQTAFADFLFDPFEDGIKGMLRGFVDVLRRMVAEAAAAKIFGSKKSGGLGLGDLVTGAVGSLFGFAQGGSFNVGGSGGTDSQLVAFKATPGERVSVATPAQQGRGSGRSIVVTQHVTVNAAQLTQDQAARMVADSQRMMWDELDRRYGLA